MNDMTIETLLKQTREDERRQIVAALRRPSEATLRAFWDNLPSPIEIDLEDDEAGIATLRAVANAIEAGAHPGEG